jgi:putative tricarboxylic transport membrane protein
VELISIWQASIAGLGQVFAWPEIGLLAAGVMIGAVVGILPGLGGSATLAMLLPFTLGLPPTQSFALLIGVAAVVATTGDLTAILVGIPGEAISAATVMDGHPMATRGEGARAIGASLVSSLAGSIFGAVTLALTIPLALVLARSIGSPELFMLALLGISYVAPISGSSRLKGLAAGGLGLLLATIGLDPLGATPRFTLGQLSLWDGIGPIPVALGLFAIPEIVELAARHTSAVASASPIGKGRLSDGIRDGVRLWRLVLQSSAIGTALGLLPGVGASVSQWMAYGQAARRTPEDVSFGRGAIEGVIAPSAANNATLGGSLVPTLALGIPGGLLSALLLSALIMKGLVPGPAMLVPEARGGHLTLVFMLMWLLVVANIFAVALACVSTDLLVRITQVSAARLVPFLLLLTFVGAFAERQATGDLLVTCAMGALGLGLVRYGWPRAPVLMGLVLGPLAESRLFLSIDAFGSAWLWRPGVLVIGALIAAGLAMKPRVHPPSTPAPDTRGAPLEEPIFAGIIIVFVAVAFAAAGSYSPRAALLPRAAAVVTIGLLVAAFMFDPRLRGAWHRHRLPSLRSANVVVCWIPIFLFLIWALGFVAGAPLAVLGYHLLAGRQRPAFAVLSGFATCACLYVVFYRLFRVPFPPGALLAWAAIGRL